MYNAVHTYPAPVVKHTDPVFHWFKTLDTDEALQF